MLRCAAFVTYDRNVQLRPYLMTVFMKVTFFNLIAFALPRNNFLHQLQIWRNILRIGDRLKTTFQQFTFAPT